jgi:hypothetical protein
MWMFWALLAFGAVIVALMWFLWGRPYRRATPYHVHHAPPPPRQETTQSQEFFRYQNKFGLGGLCISLAVCVPCSMGFGFLGLGFLLNGRQLEGLALSIIGLFFVIVGVSLVFHWLRGSRSELFLTDTHLNWVMNWGRFRNYAKSVECSDVAMIQMSENYMKITTRDGEQQRLPQGCVGDLDALGRALHEHFPHIVVIYDLLPTCEVCGAPSKYRSRAEGDTQFREFLGLNAESKMSAHYYCVSHASGDCLRAAI